MYCISTYLEYKFRRWVSTIFRICQAQHGIIFIILGFILFGVVLFNSPTYVYLLFDFLRNFSADQ